MIDEFCILHKGGSILWSRKLTKQTNNINILINDVLLEEKSGIVSYAISPYTLKWLYSNEYNLIFIVMYLSISNILYTDNLLEIIKKEFIDMYKLELINKNYKFNTFDVRYDMILSKFETLDKQNISKVKVPRSFAESKKSLGVTNANKTNKKEKEKEKIKSDDEDQGNLSSTESIKSIDHDTANESADEEPEFQMDIDKLKQLKLMQGKAKSRFSNVPKSSPPSSSLTSDMESIKKPKSMTTWDDAKLNKKQMEALDMSTKNNDDGTDKAMAFYKSDKPATVSTFEYDEPEDDIDITVSKTSTGPKSIQSSIFGYFQQLTGNKTLDESDLAPVLEGMRQSLMAKNVAVEIASKLCDSVSSSLLDKKLGSFSSVYSVAKQAMEEALFRILTPRRSVDILHSIKLANEKNRPYSIVFCGVNGVGKSTSLAKITHYLQVHGLKVSIVACDTFRAGAVEQLRTHSKCLGVTLYDQGYNKDAALVAQYGIQSARAEGANVVLVDTAGRMQNNDNLMKALAKLIHLNNPDLVLFVGEALVGNDGVDQLDKFNKALERESVDKGKPRGIDGIVLTKFDTIDDKVGAAISMTYMSGQPIMFVGTGQTYNDLKRMNPKTLINSLFK